MGITVVLAAGGTAGHVNPMLATARALAKADPEVHIVPVGTASGMEGDLVREAGFELRTIPRVPMPRALNLSALRFPKNFRQAIARAGEILDAEQADVVLGFGGYVSTPVYLAARKRNIPVVVHEGNARPGMANRVGAKFARVVALTFANTKLHARHGVTETIGLPMRSLITDLVQEPGGRKAHRAEYARELGIDPDKPILVVTGGSSGALHINEVVSAAAADLVAAGIAVLHLTGKGKDDPVREMVSELPAGSYVVLDYLEEMNKAYALADMVITRAGAGMVAEVSALGIPAVFVPLPIGNGEQALNAQSVVEAGGAMLVRNENFSESWIHDNVLPAMAGEQLARMAARAVSVSPLTAADRLAELVIEASGAVTA